MGYTKAFQPYYASVRDEIERQTFGHLAPCKNVSYKGWVLFAKSAFDSGNCTVIDFNFGELESSPWLFEFIEEYALNMAMDDEKYEEGAVYKITGTFRNYRLFGQPKKIIT